MKGLTIASGIIMIAAGAFCFVNPGQTFMTMAFVIGTVMALCGIIHVMAYTIGRTPHGKGDNNGWILIDALLTLLLGILVLFNQLTVDMAIPMVFGMWVLVSGLLRLEAASRIDRQRKPGNFKATLITGIITVVIGFLGFVNPFVTYVSIISILGFFMLVQGINSVELGFNMPHRVKDDIKIYKKQRTAVRIEDEDFESRVDVQERVIEKRKMETEQEFIEAAATSSIGISREEAEAAIAEIRDDKK
ncbi:MAG: HdeD family acid-resistance protein [Lentihominibacter sp.]